METTSWKPLRELDPDVRSAVYQRLGLAVKQESDTPVHSPNLYCRHCKSLVHAESLRIVSAPGPHWYEWLCPSQINESRYCEGSGEDFYLQN